VVTEGGEAPPPDGGSTAKTAAAQGVAEVAELEHVEAVQAVLALVDGIRVLNGSRNGDCSPPGIPPGDFAMPYSSSTLIDHIHLRVQDLDASKRFYRAALQSLGLEGLIKEGPSYFSAGELWIDAAEGASSHVHVALRAADAAAVQRFHAAVLAAGGRDNGAPGERPYHPGYYAAFAYDPDGHNIEAVWHGQAQAPTVDDAARAAGP
jgi:catechol 2,3-dioxygenase-like lactoylglutathione lyase family enzyme